jgi:BMFP domain-containing protein YqiC
VQEQFVDIDELERMHGGSAEDIRTQLDGARERNNQLLTRIQELEAELQSAWALGLSDEPPPGYSSARESLT